MASGEAAVRLGQRPGLDVLRAVGVFAVVAAHSGVGPTRAAATAVTVLFVLSGFLITSGLLEQRDRDGVRVVRFYERRARRLLPALVPMLLVGVVLNLWLFPDASPLATFATGATFQLNWLDAAGHDVGVFGGLWSLAVEEHFYLIWPAVVAFTPARRLPLVLAVIVAGSWSLSLLPVSDFVQYRATPFRMGELAVGALTAVAWRAGVRVPWSAAALGAIGVAYIAQRPTWVDYLPLGPIVGGLGAAAVVLWLTECPLHRFDWSRRYTYGIYLWHAPVYLVALELGFQRWGLLAVSVPVTVGIAWCSHHWIEKRWWIPAQTGSTDVREVSGLRPRLAGLLAVAPATQMAAPRPDTVPATH